MLNIFLERTILYNFCGKHNYQLLPRWPAKIGTTTKRISAYGDTFTVHVNYISALDEINLKRGVGF